MPSDPYYNTSKHKKWREKVMKRDGYLCQECRRYGKRTEATHAHHIEPRLDRPELKYIVSNGIALCTECHNKLEPRGKR